MEKFGLKNLDEYIVMESLYRECDKNDKEEMEMMCGKRMLEIRKGTHLWMKTLSKEEGEDLFGYDKYGLVDRKGEIKMFLRDNRRPQGMEKIQKTEKFTPKEIEARSKSFAASYVKGEFTEKEQMSDQGEPIDDKFVQRQLSIYEKKLNSNRTDGLLQSERNKKMKTTLNGQSTDARYVFLDIDGVMNSESDFIGKNGKQIPGPRCGVFTGMGASHLRILSKLVNDTEAKIVLSSSWKYLGSDSSMRKYMLKKFRKYGIKIFGTTYEEEKERGPLFRGFAIKSWLKSHAKESDSFVILDDESFDYGEEGLLSYLVKTEYQGHGFGEDEEKKAEEILSNLKDGSFIRGSDK